MGIQETKSGAEKMTRCLRALATLPGNPGSFPAPTEQLKTVHIFLGCLLTSAICGYLHLPSAQTYMQAYTNVYYKKTIHLASLSNMLFPIAKRS